MYVGRDLWRHPVQHLTQSRNSFKVGSGCTGLHLVKDGDTKASPDNFSWSFHSTVYAHCRNPCYNVHPLPLLDSLHITEKGSNFSTVPQLPMTVTGWRMSFSLFMSSEFSRTPFLINLSHIYEKKKKFIAYALFCCPPNRYWSD